MRSPSFLELLVELPPKHPTVGDDELRQLIRQGVLLARDLFDRNGHPALQTKPKEVPRELIEQQPRAAAVHNPQQVLRVHLKTPQTFLHTSVSWLVGT